MIKDIQLLPPHVIYKNSFLSALDELETNSEKLTWIHLGDQASLETPARDFYSYVETLKSAEFKALPHFVRNKIWWAIYDGEVVGRISLRLELNEFLRLAGGHIVRVPYRGKGIATYMLKTILEEESAREIQKLLITCDISNIASEKTILKNGGVFQDIVELEGRENKKRFWINLD